MKYENAASFFSSSLGLVTRFTCAMGYYRVGALGSLQLAQDQSIV
jgi:hypothetical protein